MLRNFVKSTWRHGLRNPVSSFVNVAGLAVGVAVAMLIAMPLAWYFKHRWLENFTYRADMPWWVFAVAGVLAPGIAFLTASVQRIRAAVANPVKSLRNE